jgi:hypothetical protein
MWGKRIFFIFEKRGKIENKYVFEYFSIKNGLGGALIEKVHPLILIRNALA